MNEITIDSPPPRGVGTVWELLLLGTSSKLLFTAYLRNKNVMINDKQPDSTNNKNKLIKIIRREIYINAILTIF